MKFLFSLFLAFLLCSSAAYSQGRRGYSAGGQAACCNAQGLHPSGSMEACVVPPGNCRSIKGSAKCLSWVCEGETITFESLRITGENGGKKAQLLQMVGTNKNNRMCTVRLLKSGATVNQLCKYFTELSRFR
ncbi:MAG: hypothetical protein ACO20H_00885 [Bacteriovoracaceae bacterium]